MVFSPRDPKFVRIAGGGGGGKVMTTFGDLGDYVDGFTCSPQ